MEDIKDISTFIWWLLKQLFVKYIKTKILKKEGFLWKKKQKKNQFNRTFRFLIFHFKIIIIYKQMVKKKQKIIDNYRRLRIQYQSISYHA